MGSMLAAPWGDARDRAVTEELERGEMRAKMAPKLESTRHAKRSAFARTTFMKRTAGKSPLDGPSGG
jgi:hypothetical protein